QSFSVACLTSVPPTSRTWRYSRRSRRSNTPQLRYLPISSSDSPELTLAELIHQALTSTSRTLSMAVRRKRLRKPCEIVALLVSLLFNSLPMPTRNTVIFYKALLEYTFILQIRQR